MSGRENTDGGPAADPVPPPQPPARSGAGPWTRVILIASLVLNLVLLGAIAGAGISHRAAPERRMAAEGGLGLLYDALPGEDQRAMRRAVVAGMREHGPTRGAMVADTRALLAALRSDPFDRTAAEAALDRQRMRAAGFLETGSARMLDHIAAMSPAARQAYADRLEETIHRRAPLRAGE